MTEQRKTADATNACVTRWREAASALKNLHGWPWLDVWNLTHRRRHRTETEDVLGPLHKVAPSRRDSWGNPVGFDDGLARSRRATLNAMLHEAIDATAAVRPFVRAADGDADRFVLFTHKLHAAIEGDRVHAGQELDAVSLAVELVSAHAEDSAVIAAGRTVTAAKDDGGTTPVGDRGDVTLPDGTVVPDRLVTRAEAVPLLSSSISAVRRRVVRKRDKLDPIDKLGANVSARYWLSDLRARDIAIRK